jgi:hypothetical protein
VRAARRPNRTGAPSTAGSVAPVPAAHTREPEGGMGLGGGGSKRRVVVVALLLTSCTLNPRPEDPGLNDLSKGGAARHTAADAGAAFPGSGAPAPSNTGTTGVGGFNAGNDQPQKIDAGAKARDGGQDAGELGDASADAADGY